MPRVVYVALQQFCDQDGRPLDLLREAGFQVTCSRVGRRLLREEMPNLLQEADAVIAGVEPYDAELLQTLTRLRCISRCGIGTDAIDLEAARRQGIAVLTTPDEVVEPVAQMTLSMILALARNLPRHIADLREGLWKKRSGTLLSEWTIGLIGFGRIGRAVGRYLKPFGAHLLVSDPKMGPKDMPAGVGLCELDELLKKADLVSLHAHRARSEGPLLAQRELSLMKKGSFLVNTARGFLVDEKALVAALESEHLAGAALDVFEEEPYRGALTHFPQVILTPHVATLTKVSRVRMELRAAQNVVTFFDGK